VAIAVGTQLLRPRARTGRRPSASPTPDLRRLAIPTPAGLVPDGSRLWNEVVADDHHPGQTGGAPAVGFVVETATPAHRTAQGWSLREGDIYVYED
jgi:hypothetical protein